MSGFHYQVVGVLSENDGLELVEARRADDDGALDLVSCQRALSELRTEPPTSTDTADSMIGQVVRAAAVVVFVVVLFLTATGCRGGVTAEPPNRDAGLVVRDGGMVRDAGPSEDAGVSDGGIKDAGTSDAASTDAGRPACYLAEGTRSLPTVVHGTDQVSVVLTRDEPCRRQYEMTTTAPLRVQSAATTRVIEETAGAILRTGNVLVDALYAMTNEERIAASVSSIQNAAFDDGRPIPCAAPGCFETGRLWTWVWTRDTAYAADLGLALMDPERVRVSLEFKVSPLRGGAAPEIIQDTGSGGSYPVSTDRVSWALGSQRTLAVLSTASRAAHEAVAYEALVNTIERDRILVFDSTDGLYRGEHSFLDWREQSYAPWTAADTVHLAMSKALSTNVLHLEALRYTARLATRAGDSTAAARYADWADRLAIRIHDRFWIDDEGLWSSHTVTTLDDAPARHYDLLGTSLAVLAQIGTDAQRRLAVARYPHLVYGPPVVWPASPEVPIYHNRAMWPFVTAYNLRAAREVENAAVITHAARSIHDGAALHLSNMENLEVESGRVWVDDGPRSGPVVNSERQLWSVAAMYTLVHDVIFGWDVSLEGVRFRPALTRALRRTWFGGSTSIVLDALPWRGGRVAVRLHLPATQSEGDAILDVGSIRLNGVDVGTDWITDAEWTGDDIVDITLVDEGRGAGTLRMITDGAIVHPVTPSITAVTAVGGALRVGLDRGRADPTAVRWSVYRDGARIASGIPGSSDNYDDMAPTGGSHCYAVELTDAAGLSSHRSRPACFWGAAFERTRSFLPADFTATGGTLVNNHGRPHYEAWGDPGHRIEIGGITPSYSGPHLVQVAYGNGAGPVDSGITCAVKRVQIIETPSEVVVGVGYVIMPHLGVWSRWADSSFVEVELMSSRQYRIVIDADAAAINMSAFQHYERYTGGTGGRDGAFFRVNISEVKLLSRSGDP